MAKSQNNQMTSSFWLQPLTLEGEKVKLIPLERSHKAALLEAAADGELWNFWYTTVPSEETIDAYLDFALNEQKIDRALPFVVISKKDGKVIGSTRYCKAEAAHRRLEIGYTWYAKRYQRTGVNTECKYLLLTHAFEQLNTVCVQFMTHWFNYQSRKAILRIGAKQDGVIRNHRIDKDGHVRDTVLFSIIENEWPTVKKSLKFEMKKYK